MGISFYKINIIVSAALYFMAASTALAVDDSVMRDGTDNLWESPYDSWQNYDNGFVDQPLLEKSKKDKTAEEAKKKEDAEFYDTDEVVKPEQKPITILADTSLTVPLSIISRNYGKKYNVAVSNIFSSTKTQIKEVEDGMEADIMVAAKPVWIDAMQEKGLIDVYSRSTIAKNHLVIARSRHSQNKAKTSTGSFSSDSSSIRSKLPIYSSSFQLAVADPEYMAEGTYAFESLMNLGLTGELESHYNICRSLKDVVDATVKYDMHSVMFQSEALLNPDIDIVSVFPEKSHKDIAYQAVVVFGHNMKGAREFMEYLKSDEAKQVMTAYGL